MKKLRRFFRSIKRFPLGSFKDKLSIMWIGFWLEPLKCSDSSSSIAIQELSFPYLTEYEQIISSPRQILWLGKASSSTYVNDSCITILDKDKRDSLMLEVNKFNDSLRKASSRSS